MISFKFQQYRISSNKLYNQCRYCFLVWMFYGYTAKSETYWLHERGPSLVCNKQILRNDKAFTIVF